MENKEHYLHSIDLIETAVLSSFNYLKDKYLFTISNFSFTQNVVDSKSSSIQKKDCIICFYITKREAFEIFYISKKWNTGQYENMFSFIYVDKSKSEVFRNFFSELRESSTLYEKYTQKWYEHFIMGEIRFIELNFPQVLNDGDLSILDSRNL